VCAADLFRLPPEVFMQFIGGSTLHIRLAAAMLALGLIGLPTTLEAQEARRYLGRGNEQLALRDDAAIAAFLHDAKVIESEQMAAGTTGIYRVVLELDGIQARAAFRSVNIKEERTQLPNGKAYAAFYDRAISEVAAYQMARLLELPMVPPAVERHWDGMSGAVQLWIEGAITEGERARENLRPDNLSHWRLEIAAMRVFDALIGNHDRNTGNSLLDDRGHLWLIDHTRAFQRPRGGLELDEVTLVPADLLEGIRALDEEQCRALLGELLESQQITAMFDRREELLAHFDELIAVRGAAAVVLSPLGDETSAIGATSQ